VVNDKERRPLLDLDDLAARSAAVLAPTTDPFSVDGGRSGASGSRGDDPTPSATRQVDGLA